MKRFLKTLLLVLVSFSILLGSVPVVLSQVAPQIPRSETLIVDILGGRIVNPKRFNPWVLGVSAGTDSGIQQLMLESLWMVEYAKGRVLNVLAKQPPIYNKDFTQMTVKLREGIYWSDGVEFTADDVIFTVETLKNNPGMTYNAEFSLYVDKVYKTDKYTVVFDLKQSNSRFHTYFLDRWGACRFMPKHVFEKVKDPKTFDFYPPISVGPYVLKDVDPAGYWRLWERRKDWNRTATGKMYGMPKPRYVLFMYYGPPEKKAIAQVRHELDMCDLTTETLRAMMQQNQYGRSYRKEFPWVVNIDPCITGIVLNTLKFPFNIKDVRWALTLAIDIVDTIGIAFDGAATMGALLIPPTPVYQRWYYRPMETWLKNFTLDIQVDGKPFKPYDTSAPFRLAEYCKKRGYPVPPENKIKEIFGYGWWKYAPDVAEKLLERNGFKRGSDGKWLLPDGKPWKITIISATNPAAPGYRNGFAVAQQWRRFGIDVEVQTSEQAGTITQRGDYEASVTWPAREPWGGHPDLYRTFEAWRSKYVKPIGEMALGGPGYASRWSDKRLDAIIDQMEQTAFDDPNLIKLGIEGLKIVTAEMPSIPTFGYPGVVGWDEYYWTNYPGGENSYSQPYHHWPNFKFMLPFLKPTGRK